MRPENCSGIGDEERLLGWIVSAGVIDSEAGELPSDLAAIDWRRFVALARRHRVASLIWRGLETRRDIGVPASVRSGMEQANQENALNVLRLISHLSTLLTSFRAHDITAMSLKGLSLAARHYGDVMARHAGDIDLLVGASDLAKADELIRGLGYQRLANRTHVRLSEEAAEAEDTDYRLHYVYVSPQGVVVELHFRLHNNPDVLPVSVEDIVAAGATVKVGPMSLPAMPNSLQFIFLCTHGARHEWLRIQWIADIAVMAARASPGEVRMWLRDAACHGLLNPAVQGLVLAQHLFRVAIPAEAEAALARSWRIRYMVTRAEATYAAILDREHKSDGPSHPLQLGRRLYRMCLSGRPRYLFTEFRDGLKAALSIRRRRNVALPS